MNPQGMAYEQLKSRFPNASASFLRANSAGAQSMMTPSKRRQLARARQEKAVANGNSIIAPRIRRGSWRSGWVTVGSCKFFARSQWEADYARFLQWQKERHLIISWEHEPQTFWFPVKRGRTNYTPDFRVIKFAGAQPEYHEVKGWMDQRSRTVLNRMRIHHPKEIVRVVGADWFKANKHLLRRSK